MGEDKVDSLCSVTTFSMQCIAFESMTDCRFPGRIGSTGLNLFQLDHCAEILFTSPKTCRANSCYYFFANPGFHPSLLFMSGLLSIGSKKVQNFIQRSIPLPTQAHLRLSLISDLGSNAIFEICGSAIELLRIGLRLESQPVRECYMGRENFKTLCNQRILVTLVKWVRRNAQNIQLL